MLSRAHHAACKNIARQQGTNHGSKLQEPVATAFVTRIIPTAGVHKPGIGHIQYVCVSCHGPAHGNGRQASGGAPHHSSASDAIHSRRGNANNLRLEGNGLAICNNIECQEWCGSCQVEARVICRAAKSHDLAMNRVGESVLILVTDCTDWMEARGRGARGL